MNMLDNFRKKLYGAYETPKWIFDKYIFPKIVDKLYNYIWVDMFCGSGNLVLPILEHVEKDKRVDFFEKHVFLYDILPEMVQCARNKAIRLGIPEELAKRNIQVRDTLKNYPTEILRKGKPVFHITNPPYLYTEIPQIDEKRFITDFWRKQLKNTKLFRDPYHLALYNDLVHGIEKMIYIVPMNFLYGSGEKIRVRKILLRHYYILDAIFFDTDVFEETGQRVALFYFSRKQYGIDEKQELELLWIRSNNVEKKRKIVLLPEDDYRPSTSFEEFVKRNKSMRPLKVKFLLHVSELEKNKGDNRIVCIDTNEYEYGANTYNRKEFFVNNQLYEKIIGNQLYLRTIDKAGDEKKLGLYRVKDDFGADCLMYSVKRTKPRTLLHVFIEPKLSNEEQCLLMKYFNVLIEYFRHVDEEMFLKIFKYDKYRDKARRYLSITQARKLIETFPILELSSNEKNEFKKIVEKGDAEKIIEFVKKRKKRLFFL